jgi:hypothetical protein
MKKQIAILATMLVATGFTAFGQDWLEISISGTKFVWDESTTPGVGVTAGAGEYDVAFLWAPTGTTDLLPSIGTEFGSTFTPANQVATNQVTSTGSGVADLEQMLTSGGWNVGSVFGSSGTNLITTTTGAKGAISPTSGTQELQGGSGASGSSIEMIFVAFNSTANLTGGTSALESSIVDLGWSNPFSQTVGSGSSDPEAGLGQLGVNGFGVAPVPEPTTLALAGLGGLSMLFLRRRKA